MFYVRSAVKSLGVERFRGNCQRATDGFNHVLSRLAEHEHRPHQMMERVREGARRAAGVARAHSTLHAAEETTTTTTPDDASKS